MKSLQLKVGYEYRLAGSGLTLIVALKNYPMLIIACEKKVNMTSNT